MLPLNIVTEAIEWIIYIVWDVMPSLYMNMNVNTLVVCNQHFRDVAKLCLQNVKGHNLVDGTDDPTHISIVFE
jgi:hypothetical protein